MRGHKTQEAPTAPGSRASEPSIGHKRDKLLSGENPRAKSQPMDTCILLLAKMGLEVLEEYMFMADSKTFSRILIGFSAK